MSQRDKLYRELRDRDARTSRAGFIDMSSGHPKDLLGVHYCGDAETFEESEVSLVTTSFTRARDHARRFGLRVFSFKYALQEGGPTVASSMDWLSTQERCRVEVARG